MTFFFCLFNYFSFSFLASISKVDWGVVNGKGSGIAMSTDQGRDEMLVIKKGFFQIKQFNDVDDRRVKGDLALNTGPGKYREN